VFVLSFIQLNLPYISTVSGALLHISALRCLITLWRFV